MKRLTHEADFGLEEWEQTLYSVNSDQGGAYNILDIANHKGEEEFDEILKTISLGLKHYEDTGLTPGADPGAEGAGYGESAGRDSRCIRGHKTDLLELQELSDQLF